MTQQAAGTGVLLFQVDWKTAQSASLVFGANNSLIIGSNFTRYLFPED